MSRARMSPGTAAEMLALVDAAQADASEGCALSWLKGYLRARSGDPIDPPERVSVVREEPGAAVPIGRVEIVKRSR